jgi:transcriptional regulator with XRE-family HTH domain
MIDYRQIRAARALLNWSQPDLARASGLATSSIKNIESEAGIARKETLDAIFEAFDRNGVEFLAASGVRLKSHIVTVHDDRLATTELLDDIYNHVQTAAAREVLITGLDEGFSIETDGQHLLHRHVARLTAAGIRERILVCEGDTRFLNSPESYRWLPRDYFSRNAPIYVYGDRVAIHSGSLRRRTVILEHRPLAQHLRMQFMLLWDKVSIVPSIATVPENRQSRARAA